MGNVPVLRWGHGFSWNSTWLAFYLKNDLFRFLLFLLGGGRGTITKTVSFLIAHLLRAQGPASLILGQVLNHLELRVAGTKSK